MTMLRARRHQRGAILLIALVSLVILMLAAVALFRTVDAGALIASNMAMRQAAISSSDKAVSDAITALVNLQNSDSLSPWQDANNPLNKDNPTLAPSYYSSANPAFDLTQSSTWSSVAAGETDLAQNYSQFIIQRMCSTANQIPSTSTCLFNTASQNTNSMKAGDPQPVQTANNIVYRITVRTSGPKNTVSYTQTFVN